MQGVNICLLRNLANAVILFPVNSTGTENMVTADKKKEIFAFLVALRNSGKINMFGAAPYVADEFGLSVKEARAVCIEWMESFKG